jgi:hypothetical protein
VSEYTSEQSDGERILRLYDAPRVGRSAIQTCLGAPAQMTCVRVCARVCVCVCERVICILDLDTLIS